METHKEALSFTATHNSIVTIGIKPNRPETGYGYICAEENKKKAEIRQVIAFKEKPEGDGFIVGNNIKLYNCRNCIVHTAEEKPGQPHQKFIPF